MRRADRLFQIVQLLRHDRAITARAIADELEVSERTIYRDIQDLSRKDFLWSWGWMVIMMRWRR